MTGREFGIADLSDTGPGVRVPATAAGTPSPVEPAVPR